MVKGWTRFLPAPHPFPAHRITGEKRRSNQEGGRASTLKLYWHSWDEIKLMGVISERVQRVGFPMVVSILRHAAYF